ncbi:N-acetylglucosamine-6-phosphate deacetylase [Terriglobus albidus]|uniref:N-acetylglucosamine-6-phosphate deacetylase n=1 Tax=Terriglobus albidus TaxID=1592106 RepID=UPI0021E06498|nr:N-acetylglucosamine-6-phosphate deacetylase [Terriglobus albidus]
MESASAVTIGVMKRLSAKALVTSSGVLSDPIITIDADRIVRIATRDEEAVDSVDYEFPDCTLTAGYLDIHFHGIAGHDVMNASTEGLGEVARHLAHAGISRFLPTTVTAALDDTLTALENMATFIEAGMLDGGAQAAGIHIEGPFLSHGKRGMHPAEFLLPPSPELLKRLWEASRGNLGLMTIAPELPGALETIRYAVSLGIRCSVGHSMATKSETLAGIEAGAVTATHTFNAMRPLDHREPGILGVVLDRDDLYAELICDGMHVAPEMVRLWLKAKGPDRAILITDCLAAAGMPDGTYKAGGTVVRIKGSACVTDEGTLAGSIITLDRAVENFLRMTGAPLPVAARLAASNPARMLGLPEELIPGAWADFNLYGTQGERRGTMLRGELL